MFRRCTHTPNAFRFTIAMLCAIFDVAERTLRNNVDSLLEDEEIAYCDISQYAISGGNNRTYETTLNNLNVLNRSSRLFDVFGSFFSVFGRFLVWFLVWFLRGRRIYFDLNSLVFPIAFDSFDAKRPSLRQCFLQ